MGSVFMLTVKQLSGRWRLAIMTVLAGLLVGFTLLVMRSDGAPSVSDFEAVVISGMLLGSIGPLIIVAAACVAFSNEIEDRTLANLTLAPIPRWQIVLPKLAASVAVSAPFVVGSAFLTSLIAFDGDTAAIASITISSFVGLILYAAVFVWLGLVSKQAIGVGLLYIVLWEGFFSGFVSGIRLFSIRSYTLAWMHGLDPRRFSSMQHVDFTVAAGISVVIVALFLSLSVRKLRTMDVP